MIILVTVTLFVRASTFTKLAINSLLTSCGLTRGNEVPLGCHWHNLTTNLNTRLTLHSNFITFLNYNYF